MNHAKWIWLDGESVVNQYVDFMKEFTVDTVDETAEIKISVDSEYALFLNGEILGSCQYDDYPDAKVYDTYQIGNLLKPGKNELSIHAYYQGAESFQYAIGTPGLWFSLENGNQTVVSDESVLCRQSAQYTCGEIYKITNQISFGFQYDASKESNPWENAVESSIETTLSPRPIERTLLPEPTYGKLISQGYFIRKLTEGTVAQQMKSDFLSFRRNSGAELPFGGTDYPYLAKDTEGDGVYMLIDLEQEMAGLLTLTLTAQRAGAVVEIAYGEHLDDMRVRSYIGGRNYAVSYTCKEGKQTFTHWFKRLAGRYLELRIRNFGEMTVHGVGLISIDYPLDDSASEFISPDSLHNKIFQVSKHTAKLCMHEHYEDCPGREQAIYGGDSRFQMLATYYGFGEYKFPRASLDLLAQHPLGNGQVRMVAPTDTRMVIPSFSLWWILGMKEYAEYSGDLTLAEKHWDLLMDMLKTNLGWEKKDGIITPPNVEGFWHFFEWTPGHHPRPDSIYRKESYDEPDFLAGIYHLVFWNAMKNLLELAKLLGKEDVVAEYTPTLNRLAEKYCNKFWDEEHQAFAAYERDGELFQIGEYSQIFALYSGICQDESIKDILFTKLLNNEYPVPAMLSVASLKYEALLWHKPECAKEVFRQIGTRWGAMLQKGATSFWETDLGSEDFAQGGSCCHGWASIPIYLYLRYAAGIKPDGSLDNTFHVFDKLSAKTTLLGKEIRVEK